jgi:hypothetical protein
MCITSSSQVTRPFTLCCIECDAGVHIETPEQALAEGWIDIEEDFGGLSWNYVGVCPECQADET